MKFTEKTK